MDYLQIWQEQTIYKCGAEQTIYKYGIEINCFCKAEQTIGMWWSIGRCSTARTIGGGLLTIVHSTEQTIGKLGVEQAGWQVLLFWKVHCFQYIYFLQSTF